jgi:hypothetical protein
MVTVEGLELGEDRENMACLWEIRIRDLSHQISCILQQKKLRDKTIWRSVCSK